MIRPGPLEQSEISIADVVRILRLFKDSDQISLNLGLDMIGVKLMPMQPKRKAHREPTDRRPKYEIDRESIIQQDSYYLDSTKPIATSDFFPSSSISTPAIDLPPTKRLPLRPLLPNPGKGTSLRFDFADDKVLESAPLLEPRQERNTLRELCSISVTSAEIDVKALYRRVIQGEPYLGSIPRRRIKKPARRIFIAADANPRMAVFANDAEHIAKLLGHTTNSMVEKYGWLFLDEIIHTASKDHRGTLNDFGGVGFPDRLVDTDLLLLASDLGLGDWGRKESWRLPTASALCQLTQWANRDGATVAALVPLTPLAWGNLPRGVRALYWDRRSTPSMARRAVAEADQTIGHWGKLADGKPALGKLRLARACIFAPRASPSLLRALRLAMLPMAGPEAEAQVWCSSYLYPMPGGFASVDQSLLEDQAVYAISWTRLSQTLRENGRTDLLNAMGGNRPMEDKVHPSSIALRPNDWNQAGHCLALELSKDENLFQLLTDFGRAPWTEELEALRDGLGCIFLEQAWEITQTESSGHPLDRFEEALLWAAYQDSLAVTDAMHVHDLLNQLIDALTGSDRLDEREAAFTWAMERLMQLPSAIQQQDGWKTAAMIVGEASGMGFDEFGSEAVWNPILEGRGLAHFQRARRRDVYAWRVDGKDWHLGLQPPTTGLPLPLRLRAPGSEQVLLYVLPKNTKSGRSLNLSNPAVSIGAAEEYEIVTLAGDRYTLAEDSYHPSRSSAAWLRLARDEQACADWIAAGRWADQAFQTARSEKQRLAAATCEAEAAIVTEDAEQGQLALSRLQALLNENLNPGTGNLHGKWRRLRAARACMGLLAIDSRLAEALALGQSALNAAKPSNAASNLALCAYQALLRADMLALIIRSIDMERGRIIASELESDISMLAPRQSTSRLAARAMACGWASLEKFYFETGETSLCGPIAQRAERLMAETQDPVAVYACISTMANHASYVKPADEAVKLFERLFQQNNEEGRIDRILAIGTNYLRLQFNTGRRELARLMVLDLIQEAQRRRSRYGLCQQLCELNYQEAMQGRQDFGILYLKIQALVPEEELNLILQLKADYRKPISLKTDEQLQADILELCRSADFAKSKGALWGETYLYRRVLQILGGSWKQEWFNAERILQAEKLGGIYSDTLCGSNIFEDLATNILTLPNAPADPVAFDKALDLLERSRQTRVTIDVPDMVIFAWVYKSKLWADGSIHGTRESGVELSLAKALTEAEFAIQFADSHPRCSSAYSSFAYAQRADIRRRIGEFDAARADAKKALSSAQSSAVCFYILNALNVLASIERDTANWAAACDWMEMALRELLARGRYHANYGYLDQDVLGDLIDGKALKDIQSREKQQNADPESPAAPLDEAFIQQRHQALQAQAPRAARIFRDWLIHTGLHAGEQALPFNDFWYWGEALSKADIPEAAWFLRAAVYRDEPERPQRKPEDPRNATVEKLRKKAEELHCKAGARPDLEFDPTASSEEFLRRYGVNKPGTQKR